MDHRRFQKGFLLWPDFRVDRSRRFLRLSASARSGLPAGIAAGNVAAGSDRRLMSPKLLAGSPGGDRARVICSWQRCRPMPTDFAQLRVAERNCRRAAAVEEPRAGCKSSPMGAGRQDAEGSENWSVAASSRATNLIPTRPAWARRGMVWRRRALSPRPMPVWRRRRPAVDSLQERP